MDTDLFIVIGIVFVVLAVPAIIGAFSEGRPPRTAMVMIVLGGALIAFALYQRPNLYSFSGIPDVFVRVVGRYIN